MGLSGRPATVARAVLWTNGMVMAFDAEGHQVPAYQGLGRDVIPAIRRSFPSLVIEGLDWATDSARLFADPHLDLAGGMRR
jgi:hypothetical protein